MQLLLQLSQHLLALKRKGIQGQLGPTKMEMADEAQMGWQILRHEAAWQKRALVHLCPALIACKTEKVMFFLS